MDLSPGQYDVGLEGISRDTALQQAKAQQNLAKYISSIGGRVSAAERRRLEGKQDLIDKRLAMATDNAEEERKMKLAMAQLGL